MYTMSTGVYIYGSNLEKGLGEGKPKSACVKHVQLFAGWHLGANLNHSFTP